jgi:hypothetical protein
MSLQTDRPGPQSYCPTVVRDVTHGSVPTFIGIAYLLTPQWEAVCCTKCQRVLRWATDAESALNAALRADGQTPPALP